MAMVTHWAPSLKILPLVYRAVILLIFGVRMWGMVKPHEDAATDDQPAAAADTSSYKLKP